jgi:integrating conjugative element protein (TIGR03761 family)
MGSVTALTDIQIELATRPALRIWEGREKTTQRHGILGIPGFCKFMKGIEQAIKDDDPYADYHYQKIEEAISSLSFELENELNDIQTYISQKIPPAMKLPDIGSKSPVVVPIRFASQIGFKLVYELLKLDQIVLKLLLANHIGLLANKEKFDALDRLERKARAVINLVYGFRYTGVTRDDIASNNQKAIQAKQLMGDIPKGYLDGTLRSESAPALPLRRLQTINKALTVTPAPLPSEGGEQGVNLDEISKELDSLVKSVDSISTSSIKTPRQRKNVTAAKEAAQ